LRVPCILLYFCCIFFDSISCQLSTNHDRTSTSIVAQARRHVPDVLAVVWVSAYAPDMASFVPFYVATTELSKAWTTGSMHVRAYPPRISFQATSKTHSKHSPCNHNRQVENLVLFLQLKFLTSCLMICFGVLGVRRFCRVVEFLCGWKLRGQVLPLCRGGCA
jgi:hypothetical protein